VVTTRRPPAPGLDASRRGSALLAPARATRTKSVTGAGARPSPLLSSRPSTMPSDPREKENHEGDVATEQKGKVEKVRRYRVLFHNDDYTTMEFVVLVLMKFFHKTETEATHIMLSVHHKGYGVAGVYTKDVAETKVATVLDYAKEHGMPLRLTAEPE
jgi:ATP-dependent Clp protease adaptor protein ClpS